MSKRLDEFIGGILINDTRIRNALEKAGIGTYEQLLEKSYNELYYELHNIGRGSLKRIHFHLRRRGYGGLMDYKKYSSLSTIPSPQHDIKIK